MPSKFGRPTATAAISMISAALCPAARRSRTEVDRPPSTAFARPVAGSAGGARRSPVSRDRAGRPGGSARPSRSAGRGRGRRGRRPGAGRRRRPRIRRSSSRRGRGGAGRRRSRPRPSTGRRVDPSNVPSRRRARRAGPARRVHARDSRRGSPVRATDARGRAPTPRTSCASSRSRRRALHREGERARRVWGVVVGLPDRAGVGAEAEPLEVLEQGGVELLPAPHAVVVLDPQQDVGPGRGRHAPHEDGVRDVAEMEVAGRRWGEPGRRHSVPSVSARSRSRVSSAAWRPSAAGRARAGRPGRAAPRWPS